MGFRQGRAGKYMMRYLDSIILVGCILVLIAAMIIANKQVDTKSHKVYNCDLAEFHPDFPKEVRQKCRELRNENRSMQ